MPQRRHSRTHMDRARHAQHADAEKRRQICRQEEDENRKRAGESGSDAPSARDLQARLAEAACRDRAMAERRQILQYTAIRASDRHRSAAVVVHTPTKPVRSIECFTSARGILGLASRHFAASAREGARNGCDAEGLSLAKVFVSECFGGGLTISGPRRQSHSEFCFSGPRSISI